MVREAIARVGEHVAVNAWVVMPEHVHLVLRRRGSVPVASVLRTIESAVAQRVIARGEDLRAPILHQITRPDALRRFWLKGGGFDRNVRDDAELSRALRYMLRNPVERGLAMVREEGVWSSVRWWDGVSEGEVRCEYPARGWETWKGYK